MYILCASDMFSDKINEWQSEGYRRMYGLWQAWSLHPCRKESFTWSYYQIMISNYVNPSNACNTHDCRMILISIHYSDAMMSAMASQIAGVSIVCSTVCSGADHQRRHQSSASLAFVRGIHRWPVDSPQKALVTRKMFPSDDVIMAWCMFCCQAKSSVGILTFGWTTIL